MKIVHAKLVVIGPHAVGKTSLIMRHETNTFTMGTTCTVGASFSTLEAVHEDVKIKIQVWDTAGQERFRAMAPLFYRGANAALLVFDLTSTESLDNLEHWAEELQRLRNCDKIVLVVAGNKSDMQSERRIPANRGEEFARNFKASYFETSALNSSGVKELFEYISAEIARRLKEDENFLSQGEDVSDPSVDLNGAKSNSADSPSRRGCCKN